MKNKFLSIILSGMILLSHVCTLSPAFSAKDELPELTANQCYALLKKDTKLVGFERVEMGDDPTQGRYLQRDDGEYWALDITNGTKSIQMNFDIDDRFVKDVADGSVFELEVEYYNDAQGYFQLHYDAIDFADKMGEFAVTDGSKSWSKQTFVLDDAYFGNRILDKYDFQLNATTPVSTGNKTSPASIAIKSVKLTRYPAKNPIRYKGWTEESGNAYEFYRDDKIFYNEFSNLTDKQVTAEAVYRAVDGDGVTRWSGTEAVTLAPGEVKQTQMNIDCEYCQTYTLYVDIKDSANGISESLKRFDFAIIKTDPDGIQNEHQYYNPHTERYTSDEMARDAFSMMKKSNTYGIRWQLGWGVLEPTQGVYKLDDIYKRDLQMMAEYNIHALWLNLFSPGVWAERWSSVPRTPQGLEAWNKVLHWILPEIKQLSNGMIDSFEYWNEPNINLFNGQDRVATSTEVFFSPEDYVPAARVAYNAIQELWPEMKFGVLSICDVTAENSMNWLKRSMAAGLWDYCDAVTLHPYGLGDEAGMAPKVREYKDHVKDEYGTDVEIWNTEVGFTSVDEFVGTEKSHTDYNVRTYLYYLGENVGDKYITYNLEQKGYVPFDREDFFGHLGVPQLAENHGNKGFIPRRAYVGVTGMNYLTAMTKPDEQGDYDPDKDVFIYRLKSEKFHSDILTLWSLTGAKQRTLKLGQKEITISDEFGNMETLTSEDGNYSFLLTESPIYLLGDFKDFSIEEDDRIRYPEESIVAATGDMAKFSVFCEDEGAELELVVPDQVSVDEAPVFVNGEAEVQLMLSKAVCEDFPVTIKVKKDGKLIGMTDVDVTVKTVKADTRIDVALRSMEDMNKWKGTAFITNYSETDVVTGKLSILEPGLLATVKNVDIGRIPRGKTSEINFNFPDITQKGIYNLVYRIDLDSGESYESKSRVDFSVSKYSDTEKKIDGVLEKGEWDDASWMYADGIEDVHMIGSIPWGGSEDCSARITTAWDEENFYMAAEVTDDVHFNDTAHSNSYQCDDIQFALYHDVNSYLAAGQAGTRFNEFGISLNNEGPGIWRWKNQTDDVPIGEVVGEGIEYAAIRDDKTYYEIKLPWKVIWGYDFTPEPGNYIGFSYALNDNDGAGRNLSIMYAGGIVGSKNSALFSKLQFVKKED